MPSFLEPLLKEPYARFGLRILRTGHLLATKVEAAVDSETRRKGLLGRTGLADGVAMLIAPTNAIHTFFMKFPIDVVFVGRDGNVLKVRREMPAWRIGAALRSFAVVELAGGSADRAGLQVGDRLTVERVSPAQSEGLPT